MNIGLIAVDSSYPNLALMKIAAYHKEQGDNVEWYTPFEHYDKVYMAKVFNFTPGYNQYMTNADCVEKGGTGYDISKKLPTGIDRIQPDYSLYPQIDRKTAYGFLTRGCPNKCKWCIVPKKEGNVSPYMDVEEIAIDGRNELILMDNNVLASDYGLEQIEKIIRLNETRKRNIKIDFNQAIDARLVTDGIAKMLSRLKWINYIRFGCDTQNQIIECERSIELIRKHGYSKEFLLFTMLNDDFNESYNRVNFWKQKSDPKISCFSQPFRDPYNPRKSPPQWQKDIARWSIKKELFKTIDFKDYEPRKGFKCSEYFRNK